MKNEQSGFIKGERFERSPITLAAESPFFDAKELEMVYVSKPKAEQKDTPNHFYPTQP